MGKSQFKPDSSKLEMAGIPPYRPKRYLHPATICSPSVSLLYSSGGVMFCQSGKVPAGLKKDSRALDVRLKSC